MIVCDSQCFFSYSINITIQTSTVEHPYIKRQGQSRKISLRCPNSTCWYKSNQTLLFSYSIESVSESLKKYIAVCLSSKRASNVVPAMLYQEIFLWHGTSGVLKLGGGSGGTIPPTFSLFLPELISNFSDQVPSLSKSFPRPYTCAEFARYRYLWSKHRFFFSTIILG